MLVSKERGKMQEEMQITWKEKMKEETFGRPALSLLSKRAQNWHKQKKLARK